MADLRWILLLVGMLFLLSLAAWELQRTSRARRLERDEAQRSARERRDAFQADLPAPTSPEPLSASHVAEATELEATEPASPSYEPEPPVHSGRIEPVLIEPSLIDPAAAIEASPPLRVEWPDERERRIFAVRIVAPSGDRLAGRAVRQALGACGFVHGPFRIYHQPAVDGRALLSCANLTKPGDFDPLTLDFQRLTGLSMFSVLPGPASAPAALEHLLETAEDLAQRLRAELTDERGGPLDEARVASLRAAAQEWMASRSEAPSAESARGA
jgi:cell division protein ZipA